ncbi:MAG: nucleotidyltransferase family protein, partial [Candidatus Binatus sp.]|uniref:nucleotidyltransferase family protein n=1 Tax=Candidatus Binatus sp. TaxID=2811406 RepID=UPI0027207636
LANGYRLDSRMPPGEETAAYHWNSQLAMVRDTPRVNVDLHWQMLPSLFPCASYFDTVWNRLRIARFEDHEILALSDIDLLLYLCAHGARHGWKDLRLSADLGRLIHLRADLDWDQLIRSSRQAGGERVLALGLQMVNRLIGVEYPANVAEFVQATMRDQQFARRLEENVLIEVPDGDETLAAFRLQFRLASGIAAKLRCALGFSLLPTEADASSLPLPPALFFLYYAYRPARLALKYGAMVLRGRA